jgi:hypothetical protein
MLDSVRNTIGAFGNQSKDSAKSSVALMRASLER